MSQSLSSPECDCSRELLDCFPLQHHTRVFTQSIDRVERDEPAQGDEMGLLRSEAQHRYECSFLEPKSGTAQSRRLTSQTRKRRLTNSSPEAIRLSTPLSSAATSSPGNPRLTSCSSTITFGVAKRIFYLFVTHRADWNEAVKISTATRLTLFGLLLTDGPRSHYHHHYNLRHGI